MRKLKYDHCCIYCGEYIQLGKMHKQCVVDDIYETLYRGELITGTLKSRAHNFQINILEMKRIVLQDKIGRI